MARACQAAWQKTVMQTLKTARTTQEQQSSASGDLLHEFQ
jgi:hypothetical protein